MTFCDKTRIQLLCLMQLQMELLHFFLAGTSHIRPMFFFPLVILILRFAFMQLEAHELHFHPV